MRKTIIHLILAVAMALFPITVDATAPQQPISNHIFHLDMNGLALFDKIIAIDPGHGGSDTGAIGPSGVKEKDVTLAIGQDLKSLLEKDGIQVIMTRKTDQDVYGSYASPTQELQARVDIADKANADLFISIHVDACNDKDVGGTTTYYFDKTDEDDQLARYVENGLNAQLHLNDRGDRSDHLYVLEKTDMPAVLAEVGYISNPIEEKLVQDSSFRQKAALGIYNGIKNYFSSIT